MFTYATDPGSTGISLLPEPALSRQSENGRVLTLLFCGAWRFLCWGRVELCSMHTARCLCLAMGGTFHVAGACALLAGRGMAKP